MISPVTCGERELVLREREGIGSAQEAVVMGLNVCGLLRGVDPPERTNGVESAIARDRTKLKY